MPDLSLMSLAYHTHCSSDMSPKNSDVPFHPELYLEYSSEVPANCPRVTAAVRMTMIRATTVSFLM